LHRDRVRYGKSYLNQDSPKCIVIIGKPESAILRGPLLNELFKGSLQTQPPFLLYLTVGPCSADLQKTLESETKAMSPFENILFCSLPVPTPSDVVPSILNLLCQVANQQIFSKVVDFGSLMAPQQFRILKGTGLAAADVNGKSDPFCVFGIGPKLGTWTVGPFKTKIKRKPRKKL